MLANAHPEMSKSANARHGIAALCRTPPPIYQEQDPNIHSQLQFWTREQFREYLADHEDDDDDSNVKFAYLEHRNGCTISRDEYRELRGQLKQGYNTLLEHGMAASSHSQLSKEARDYLNSILYERFPGFVDGLNSWKLRHFCTTVYPDISRNRTGKGHASTKTKGKKRARDASATRNNPTKKHRTDQGAFNAGYVTK